MTLKSYLKCKTALNRYSKEFSKFSAFSETFWDQNGLQLFIMLAWGKNLTLKPILTPLTSIPKSSSGWTIQSGIFRPAPNPWQCGILPAPGPAWRSFFSSPWPAPETFHLPRRWQLHRWSPAGQTGRAWEFPAGKNLQEGALRAAHCFSQIEISVFIIFVSDISKDASAPLNSSLELSSGRLGNEFPTWKLIPCFEINSLLPN